MNPTFFKNGVWFASLILVLSCSSKEAIVGIWQYSDTSFMEFRSDHIFQTHGIGASKVTGRYSFTGVDKVKVDLTDGNSVVYKVSIKGDEMTMTEGGAVVKLHRVDFSEVKKSDEQWKAP